MAAAVFGPWYAASAKILLMKGKNRRVRRLRTSNAPSRSCIAAEWTTTFSRRPSVSTRICRLRPVTFLPALAGRAWSPLLSGLGALAVDDRGRRARLAAFALPRRHIERMVNALQRAVPLPQHEISVRRALWRQVLRQRCPLATGREHVEDRVQNLTDIHFAPPAAALGRRNCRPHQRPLSIRQIARVTQATAIGSTAMFRLPHWQPSTRESGVSQG